MTLAPAWIEAAALAMNVWLGTTTVPPSTPMDRRISSMEQVPLLVPTAYFVPQYFAHSRSNSSTLRPILMNPVRRIFSNPAMIDRTSSSEYFRSKPATRIPCLTAVLTEIPPCFLDTNSSFFEVLPPSAPLVDIQSGVQLWKCWDNVCLRLTV